MRIIPILFSADMVRAILEDRKSVTRRVIRGAATSWSFQGMERDPAVFHVRADGEACPKTVKGLYATFEADPGAWYPILKAPYEPGDILYVRETWCNANKPEYEPEYYYFADTKYVEDYCPSEWKWRPSIHMPKEAARIFLRVKSVQVERLQDITEDPPGPNNQVVREGFQYECDFVATWNRTIKPADLGIYGWDANPWVWVIEFERMEKPAGWPGEAE